jgi:LPS export ABC transporter protein LptC
MLGRLYAIIFISLIAFSLWYQRKYLERSANELNSQLDYENVVLPTSTAKQFNTNSYQDGKLKYSFSGDKITYFNDNHFEAEGNLVYQAFDENKKNTITIKTQKAYGQIESDNSQPAQSILPLGTNTHIKNAVLPNDVLFDFEGNKGIANNVFIDMDKETIQSQNHFISNGPQGNIKGKGFYYSIKNEEFKIKSNVDGNFTINKPPLNKN